VAACGCSSPALVVPTDDPTPPSAAQLQAEVAGRPLGTTTLNGAAAAAELADNDQVTVTAHGDDPDGGVQAVRIWMSTRRTRPGVVEGPTLASKPQAEHLSTAMVGQAANPSEMVSWQFDIEPLIKEFWDVYLELFAEVENFHGGKIQTATLTLHVRRVGLHLHVVPLSDDDGGHAPQVTATQFVDVVTRANRAFRGTGILLRYDWMSDWHPMSDTGMNRDQTIFTRGNALADTLPGSVLVLLRWGSDPASPTGNGNAYPPPGASTRPHNVTDADQRYVALPSVYPASGFGFLTLGNGSFVAHEMGHYLGLYHTFPGWDGVNPVFGANPTSAAAADQAVVSYILANGGSIDALDGDALADTPPDPGAILYTVHGQDVCMNHKIAVSGTDGSGPVSFSFEPGTQNAMSYYAICGRGFDPPPHGFSPTQIQRMQHALTSPQRAPLLNPP
jgi:hypothetical protein